MYEDWLRDSVDKHFVDLVALNAKHFSLHIPPDLAGHTLTFRALYSGHGVNLMSKPSGPFAIIEKCDRNDEARVAAIEMYAAWHRRDNVRVLEIADSMVASGLSDAAGWEIAHSSAYSLKLPEKMLAYLDRMYQDFGVLSVELGTADPPKPNPQASRDPEKQRNYEQRRSKLLRATEDRLQQR